jgi:nucleoside 2-deoxyribosyltransferase
LQEHTLCYFGFMNDFEAMQWADACVLVMPCGRSAHLEAGYFVGAGKPLYILLSDGEPELMYRMAWETGGTICVELSELLQAMRAKR